MMLSVNLTEMENALKKRTASLAVFKLAVDDPARPERPAMLKELQDDPVTGRYIHADFYQIDEDHKVRVRVPVVTVGKCKGVEMGGVLQIIRRELEVLCLPARIPQKIEIDISNLGVGEAIHVADIPTGAGIEIPHEVNFTLVTVLSTRKTEGPDGDEGAAEAEEEA
jgi:large subunit ribosomal protein L25